MLLFVGICFGQALLAQTRNVYGTLTDDQNQPIVGLQLNLLKPLRTTISDSLGRFQFKNLANGKYHVFINSISYQSFKQNVVIDDEDVHVNIKLRSASHLLDEVTIKNNANKQRIREESLNLEIVKSDFIQRNLGGSLMQTLQRLPGIKTIGIGSGQSKPLIRGLGFNRVVVVDKGIKHEGQQWGADHGLEIDQFAAEEVELLKGAASFVYGADAIAGAIHIKAPTVPAPNSFGGDVNLIGKTNNNLYGTSVHLYQRKNTLFFDTRITYQNYGDYRVPTDTLYVYDFAVPLHKRALRNTAGKEMGLHFNTGYLGNQFKSVFYISHITSKSGFFANAHGLEPRRVDAALHDQSDRDILMPNQEVAHFKLINRTNFNIYNHAIEAEFGYQHNFREEFNHYVNHGYMPPVYPSSLNIPINLERAFDKHVYSFNLKDHFNLGKHHLQIGANAELQQNEINGWSFLVPAFKQQTFGLYGYDKWEVNDRLLLHGALRYDFAQINLHQYTDWFLSETTNGAANQTELLVRAQQLNRNFNSLVWSIGMNYNLPQLEFKANIGKSFRIPIAKELGANGVNYHYFSYEKGDRNLNPEQSYQVDLSIAFHSSKWTVKISPFFNYFPNYIYLNPTAAHDYFYGAGNQVFQYAQSKVMRYGGEAELKYQFSSKISSSFLLEYLYAKQLSGSKKGYTLPFSPPASALFNLSYNLPKFGFLKEPYFSIDYRITAKQHNIVPPEQKTKGYQLFNLQTGAKVNISNGQSLSLSLQVQNIFNTKYLNHTSFYRLISLPEQGRNIVLSVKVPFNF
ncbi:TonB-dependent receptor [Pedobacter polaris]|uniref:TonB-dependent receptor n=2 Tax=Pedobacter polaris TaxID=2571273 RepID=A0A4U1CT28_9SPHI|nr:TonB-dependent receptor [Pedobacter polaris]